MMYCPKCGHDKLWKRGKAGSGNPRFDCVKCHTRTTTPLTEAPQLLPKFKKEPKKVYLITQAVNDTPIVKPFLETLEFMARDLDAQLIVCAGVYKNPDAFQQRAQMATWPKEVLKYMCGQDFRINKHLIVRGGTRIQHTAINPLTGMNHSNGTQSEIFGHSQLAMEMVPAPKNEIPRMLITTGTVSTRNYGNSPTAKKASFHHNNAALLVEVRGERFWVRPISWAKDHIQDLHTNYYPDGSKTAGHIEGAVYGDLHVDAMNKGESSSILELMQKLNANHNVLHDVLDMHTGSHHKKGDVLLNLRHPNHDVRKELDNTVAFLKKVPRAIVVSSNHHDHLDKWFNDFKPQSATCNLDLYYELGHLARTFPNDALFKAYCRFKYLGKFIDENSVYDICGIDVSQHGHRGPNGARGSGKAFAKTGRKTITGHSHTPGIYKGNWTVGTSAMGMPYARGYSSWLEAHALIYPTGKRTMIFRIKGKYSPMVEAL